MLEMQTHNKIAKIEMWKGGNSSSTCLYYDILMGNFNLFVKSKITIF